MRKIRKLITLTEQEKELLQKHADLEGRELAPWIIRAAVLWCRTIEKVEGGDK